MGNEKGVIWITQTYLKKLMMNDQPFEKEDLLSHFHHLTDLQKEWVILRYYLLLYQSRDCPIKKQKCNSSPILWRVSHKESESREIDE